jgi:hypothetical protein
MNPNEISAWTNGPESCIWRKHGVWDIDPATQRPRLLKSDYFYKRGTKDIDFTNDYMVPFFHKFEKIIRTSMPNGKKMFLLLLPVRCRCGMRRTNSFSLFDNNPTSCNIC